MHRQIHAGELAWIHDGVTIQVIREPFRAPTVFRRRWNQNSAGCCIKAGCTCTATMAHGGSSAAGCSWTEVIVKPRLFTSVAKRVANMP